MQKHIPASSLQTSGSRETLAPGGQAQEVQGLLEVPQRATRVEREGWVPSGHCQPFGTAIQVARPDAVSVERSGVVCVRGRRLRNSEVGM